jgi:hypothetical protein
MTTPRERTLAVLQTRKFLRKLANNAELPVAMRDEACSLLRHYPGSVHVSCAAAAWPSHFGPEYPEEAHPAQPSYLRLLSSRAWGCATGRRGRGGCDER